MGGSRITNKIHKIVNEGHTIIENIEIANAFAKNFASASSNENYEESFKSTRPEREQILLTQAFTAKQKEDGLCFPFLENELENVLTVRKNTAPGPDRVSYQMLRNMPADCLKKILTFLNKTWKRGECPASWKHSIVIPILKPGKPGDQTASYRPISMTCNLCKIMERMIANRLRWWLESKKLLTEVQSGFRRRRSTTDCLLRLHDDAYKGVTNKRYTVAAFLDFEKAYDMVWREGLIHKLSQLGITGNMLKWIHSFLVNRTFQVRINNTLSDIFRFRDRAIFVALKKR